MKKLFIIIAISLANISIAADRETICRVNPQACAALQRNDQIRAQVNNYRCKTLYNSIKTMSEPARSYQLKKLKQSGCYIHL